MWTRTRILLLLTATASATWWPAGGGLFVARAAQQEKEKTVPEQVRLFIPYKHHSQEENKRLLEMYGYLRIADISDGMDVVGLQDVGLVDPEIHALWKDTEKFSHRVIGIAVTARYVPTNKREPKMDRKVIGHWYSALTSEAFMELLQPGSILVIDAMEDGESRSIGSTNILSWRKLGMLGLVTSGGLADTDEIIHHKVPAYFRRLARGIRPGRNELESVNRPVTIGGVLVRPGDVVAADGDGVVVVPRERAAEVAEAALPFLDNITRERFIKETGRNPWADPRRQDGHTAQTSEPFRPTAEAPAMPKALMKLPRTPIGRAKFPAIDFHVHGRELRSAEDYEKMVKLMDETGLGVLCNMDGGFGATFDRNMKIGEPFRDRIIHFARLNFDGINEPGWSVKTAAELERAFLAGAAGLKINKVLGLDLKNPDGSYIQSDDRRFDPVWETCAKHDKPVMIHTSDSYGRFLPIGPDNERYEAGLWRRNPEGNYYKTGQPTNDVIEKARENMHARHPKTRFVNAHVAMLYYDMDKVAALLDKYPNADVEISASVQDLGRAPLLIRRFFIKYQDRILFGSDGNPGRGTLEFWVPHFRFLETYDEHFDHPAQLRSPTGAPLHGRWRIYGIGLPDDVLRKVYYANALKYLPSARASIQRQLAARR